MRTSEVTLATNIGRRRFSWVATTSQHLETVDSATSKSPSHGSCTRDVDLDLYTLRKRGRDHAPFLEAPKVSAVALGVANIVLGS